MHLMPGSVLTGPVPVPKVEPVAYIEWFGLWKTAGVIRVYTDDPVHYRALFTVRRSWRLSRTISFVGLVSTAKDKMTLRSLYRAVRKVCLDHGITSYTEELVDDVVERRTVSFKDWHVLKRETENVEAFLSKKKR